MALRTRLEALERSTKPASRRRELTPADWLKYTVRRAGVLFHVFKPAEGDPFDRLYSAIAAGNRDGDACQQVRASLGKRFDWAVYRATIQELGTAWANDWRKVQVPRELLASTFDVFDPALGERHPEIAFPLLRPRPAAYYYAERGRLWLGEHEITGPVVAAFGV